MTRAACRYLGVGINHRKGSVCRTRKEAEEDRETTDLLPMSKYLAHTFRFIVRDSNDLEGFGFHGVKLTTV